ncbi:hypothetical protein CYY_005561 [Polysphondylium violaceum]|uniref:FNIP repeat-containing protein n=1 Tax=Polysphondylium violaceum TaxID=133409 RepID=A0A8J4PST5_9MYCE|nr:hypothetical protein CYY_005561 [Polysphondylium violaceum]
MDTTEMSKFYFIWRNKVLQKRIQRYNHSISFRYNESTVPFTIENTIGRFDSFDISLQLQSCVVLDLTFPNSITSLFLTEVKNTFEIKLPKESIHTLYLFNYRGSIPEGFIPSSVRHLVFNGEIDQHAIPFGVERVEDINVQLKQQFYIPNSVKEISLLCAKETVTQGWIPDSVEKLTTGFTPDQGFIPKSVKVYTNTSDLKSLACLPESTRSLTLSNDHIISSGKETIPHHIKELEIISGKSLNFFPLLPAGIEKFTYRQTNQCIENLSIGGYHSLRSLSFSCQSFNCLSLPSNLQELSIYITGSLAKGPTTKARVNLFSGNPLPRSLARLSIESYYSEDIEITSNMLPESLKYLKIRSGVRLLRGCFSNTPNLSELYLESTSPKPKVINDIPSDMIPPSITRLTLGLHRAITQGSIPNSVTYLHIKRGITEPMDIKHLPQNLSHLVMDIQYYKSSTAVRFPPKLTHFSCTVNHQGQASLMPNTITHLCLDYIKKPTTPPINQPIPASVIYLATNYLDSLPPHIRTLVFYRDPKFLDVALLKHLDSLKLSTAGSTLCHFPSTLKCIKHLPSHCISNKQEWH